jgi:hypothetical protein
VSQRLTATTLPAYRKQALAAQGGACALCGESVSDGEAVTDHDHTTGVVRGVLHRGCNAMLGHIENNRARHKLTNVARLSKFMAASVEYLYRKRPDDTPLYPSHRTTDEKRELRNKRARRARASIKKGA